MSSGFGSPIAAEMAQACSDRILAFHDAQTRQLLSEMQARGFSTREQLAGQLATASHLSGHAQAKAELMAICAVKDELDAVKAQERVRSYFAGHVPNMRDKVIEAAAQDLAREGGR